MKRLIVNADDFGLHTEVNRAIIKGYQQGCLRSTSLMPTGRAAEEAAELACENPGLGVAVHITLVAEKPVLPPEKVPTLVGPDGYFFPDHIAFIRQFAAGRIRLAELRAECEAQISRVEQLGVTISHLDSHQHLHVLPKIIDLCLALMKEHGIQKMRLPAEDYLFSGGYPAPPARKIAKCGLTACARLAARKARKAGVLMPETFFGMLAGGHMEQKYFSAILHALPDGVSEIMVHPGADNKILGGFYDWQYHWEQEFSSVTSEETMQYLASQPIELISFKELSHE